MADIFESDRVNYGVIIALSVSVCLAHAAYFLPYQFGFLGLFFFIPLFFAAFKIQKNAAWYGLYWGLLFFAGQLWWLVTTLPDYVEAPWHIIIYGMLTLYFALLVAAWFYASTLLSKWLMHCSWYKAGCWALCACLYYYFLEHGSCWFLGQWWGNPLIGLLIPLAAHTIFIKPVALLGTIPYEMLILSVQAYQACCIYTGNKIVFFILSMAMLINMLIGNYWCCSAKIRVPVVGCIAPVSTAQKGAEQIGYELVYELIAYADAHPKVSVLCAPESAFPCILEERPDVIRLWQENIPLDDKLLIMGTYSKEGNAIFNSLVGISQGRAVFMYHKRNLMPFIEYECACGASIFTKKRRLFNAGGSNQKLVTFGPYQFVPFICCEFFFEQQQPVGAQEVALLCLVNDGHFLPYVGRLLLLQARLKAVVFGRVVIYCSHRYGVIIEPGGTMTCVR